MVIAYREAVMAIHSTKSLHLLLGMGVLLASSLTLTNCPRPPKQVNKYAVAGFLLVAPPRPGGNDDPAAQKLAAGIYMPGINVDLRDLLANQSVESVRTDLSGRFRFSPHKPGRYQVCWKARGLTPGCNPAFPIGTVHVYLGDIRAGVDLSNKGRTFFGTVRLADGRVPRTLEPVLGVNSFATVTVKDGGSNVLGEGFVNNFGDYIVPGVDPASGYQVGGKIEAATVGANVAFPGTLSQRVDLVFKQHAPEITGLVGNSPAGLHWTAAVGDLVKVKAMATDRDGDPLHYYWLLPDGTAVPNAPTGDTISFQLPNHGGLFEFTALVSDNRGGYAKESFTVSTDGVRFGGTVAATNAPVLAGAEIEINGKTARSDADGHFALFVPESTKYVLNIRKAGYGLVSRVYDNGLTGGHWTLTRASVDTVDPTQLIDVTNKRQPGDCPGSSVTRRATTANVDPGFGCGSRPTRW